MGKELRLRYFDYVNHPYEKIRDLLADDALSVFQSATKTAADDARSLASELHLNIAGIDLGTDIVISVSNIQQREADGKTLPSTRLTLNWEAAKAPKLFPVMDGELAVYPLTATKTQIDFTGAYEPPLGALGKAINSVVGHRIAEICVHRFVSDLATHFNNVLNSDSDKVDPSKSSFA